MYGHTPLAEAARDYTQLPKPITLIFEAFRKQLTGGEHNSERAWEDSLKEIWTLTALKQTEYEILTAIW